MYKKSYGNVMKAARLIMAKGYDKQESIDMALNIFNQLEIGRNVYGEKAADQSAERMINNIMSKADYTREYGSEAI